MQKYWDNLTPLQKLKINSWFKHHQQHYDVLVRQAIVDVISLPDSELLISFFKTPDSCERIQRILDKHNTRYIIYSNVIFRL